MKDKKENKYPVYMGVNCAHCGAENNLGFVMYYKDPCWNCGKNVLDRTENER